MNIGDWCAAARRVGATTCSDSEIAFGIKGGYQINDYFAAEFGGLWASGYETNGRNSSGNDFSIETDVSSYSIGGKASYPINDMISVHGTLGFHFWEFEASISNTTLKASVDGSDLYYGIGAALSINDNLSIGADYTQFQIDEEAYDKADYFSASLIYSF